MAMPRKPKPKGAFGKRLAAIRERLDLDQSQAAAKVGVDRSTWVRWESGTRKPAKSHLILIDLLDKGMI